MQTIKITNELIKKWNLDTDRSGLTITAPDDMRMKDLGALVRQAIEEHRIAKHFIIQDGVAIPAKYAQAA